GGPGHRPVAGMPPRWTGPGGTTAQPDCHRPRNDLEQVKRSRGPPWCRSAGNRRPQGAQDATGGPQHPEAIATASSRGRAREDATMKRMLINATQAEELRVAIVDGQNLYDI